MSWWADWQTLDLLPWPGEMWEQPQFVVDVFKACHEARDNSARAKEQRQRIEQASKDALAEARNGR